MTIWDHACCVGYGVQARAEALWHLVRGHKLHWRGDCIDLWTGHTGCITCDECPDSRLGEDGQHVGFAFWCRHWRLLNWMGQQVCGSLGHPELRHPQRGDGNDGWVDVPDEWYCYRCLADVEPAQVDRTTA